VKSYILRKRDFFDKTKISIDQARDITSVEEMLTCIDKKVPLIHLSGPVKDQLKDIFEEMKRKRKVEIKKRAIKTILFLAIGFLYFEWSRDRGQKRTIDYNVLEIDEESYLIHKKYKLDK